MLSDILGIMIAFVSIILLLSILVTAVVQFVQAGLQLRARNLRKGLADLFREFDQAKTYKNIPARSTGKTGGPYRSTRASLALHSCRAPSRIRAKFPGSTRRAHLSCRRGVKRHFDDG